MPEDSNRPGGNPDARPGRESLDSLRARADAQFHEADAAIDRVLWGDSQAFVQATEQVGGQ